MRTGARLSSGLSRFIDSLLPGGCASCGAAIPSARTPLCPVCLARLSPIPEPRCPRCGLTRVIPGPTPVECTECHAWPPQLRKAASACLHRSVAADMVRGLKYRGWTALADLMAARMLEPATRVAGPGRAVLVPVPLTRPRRRERGFNQAELLAGGLGRRTGWPVSTLLVRRRDGPPAARLGRRLRAEVVRDAFAVDAAGGSPAASWSCARRLPGALLVDDVITTGATSAACAQALADAGIRCLGVVSFSRTNPLEEPG